jgi:hypothetical protein
MVTGVTGLASMELVFVVGVVAVVAVEFTLLFGLSGSPRLALLRRLKAHSTLAREQR